MKRTIISILALAALAAVGCTDIENVKIQTPTQHSEQYYANLREYKKSDHAICYGFYAGYTSDASASMGLHFQGLPDSMDIVGLWQQIPSNDPSLGSSTSRFNEKYMPNAWRELRETREKKGTRFVMVRICNGKTSGFEEGDAGIEAYALEWARCVERNDLDGIDVDYEPRSVNDWLSANNANFVKFIKVLARFFGPQSGTGKLLIIDYNSYVDNAPPAELEPYVDYFLDQNYGGSATPTSQMTAARLQQEYNKVSSWCPAEKWIPIEQMGWYWQNGGRPFVEADGNTVDSWGNPIYSVIGMARWNPEQGRKGGFGGFYFEYEYNTTRPANASLGDTEQEAIPYYSFRRGIQEQNPAQK